MKFIVLLFFFTLNAFAIEPMDDYYANDLLEAVDQAKSSPHHYDYSNQYRYKRTTAQSIDLNRLNLKELDATRLKTATDAKEPKNNMLLVKNLNSPESEPSINSLSSEEEFSTTTTSFNSPILYSSNQGHLKSNGLTDRSTIRASSP